MLQCALPWFSVLCGPDEGQDRPGGGKQSKRSRSSKQKATLSLSVRARSSSRGCVDKKMPTIHVGDVALNETIAVSLPR